MGYSISPMAAEDRKPIIDIFNDYVENSFAAYIESKLPYQAFVMPRIKNIKGMEL